MRLFLTALVIWALVLCGACSRSAEVRSSEMIPVEQKTVAPLVLTNDRATGSFPVSPEALSRQPPIVEISISKVVNPGETPLSISVYLVQSGKKGQTESERIVVGSFSLYPPDRPGRFLLSSSSALHQLASAGADSKPDDVQLVIELKRVNETKPWTPVELTIEQPKWLRDEPK